jgi:hypothetical protein
MTAGRETSAAKAQTCRIDRVRSGRAAGCRGGGNDERTDERNETNRSREGREGRPRREKAQADWSDPPGSREACSPTAAGRRVGMRRF